MPDLTWGYSTPLRVSRAAATPMMNTGSLNRGCEVTKFSSRPSPMWTSNIRGSACTFGTILYGQNMLRDFALDTWYMKMIVTTSICELKDFSVGSMKGKKR